MSHWHNAVYAAHLMSPFEKTAKIQLLSEPLPFPASINHICFLTCRPCNAPLLLGTSVYLFLLDLPLTLSFLTWWCLRKTHIKLWTRRNKRFILLSFASTIRASSPQVLSQSVTSKNKTSFLNTRSLDFFPLSVTDTMNVKVVLFHVIRGNLHLISNQKPEHLMI